MFFSLNTFSGCLDYLFVGHGGHQGLQHIKTVRMELNDWVLSFSVMNGLHSAKRLERLERIVICVNGQIEDDAMLQRIAKKIRVWFELDLKTTQPVDIVMETALRSALVAHNREDELEREELLKARALTRKSREDDA